MKIGAFILGAAFLAACASQTENEGVSGAEAASTAAAGQIVLAYGERKAELIAAGYFEASDFTGTDVIVASAETSIDIANLVDDSDGVPESICWAGDVGAVKRIVKKMLENTDGNGDHYLDSSRIENGPRESLKVLFQWTGEDGATHHELDVVKCPE